MSKRGLLIVFSGPSGVGKGSILRPFLRDNPQCAYSVSATTRAPRRGEVDGQHYHFLSRERFEQLVRDGQVLEWAEYSGNLYGTPRAPVEEQLARGRNVILEVELQGAMKVKESCPDALFVFVMPPSMAELRKRLGGRGTESPEVMECRMRAAEREMAQADRYDFILVNHAVEESAAQLAAIIEAAPFLSKYMKDAVQEVCQNA